MGSFEHTIKIVNTFENFLKRFNLNEIFNMSLNVSMKLPKSQCYLQA